MAIPSASSPDPARVEPPLGAVEAERSAGEPLLVYRPRTSVVLVSSALAILLAILAGSGIAVAVGALASGDQTVATVALLEVVLVVPFAALLWRQSRIRLEVSAASIRAVNYFSSFRLGWQEIVRFSAGSAAIGIVAELRDGSSVRLSAIQQPNLRAWLGAPTEADDAVLALNRWLYRLRWETTSRRSSQPGRRTDAERDDAEHERGDGDPVPQEQREVAPS
jgi:PH (Pleckstrin Homology) domain-containing protein